MSSELVGGAGNQEMCFPGRQEKNVFQGTGENNRQRLLTTQEEDWELAIGFSNVAA